jgi:hypothetical protein
MPTGRLKGAWQANTSSGQVTSDPIPYPWASSHHGWMCNRSKSAMPSPVASNTATSTPSRAAAAKNTAHQANRTWRTSTDRVTR